MLRTSIRTKLKALAALATLLLVVIAAVALHSVQTMSEAQRRATRNAEAIRNTMQADMMHDALRGDVLAAMRDVRQSLGGEKEVRAALKEHAGSFISALEDNQKLELSAETIAALSSARKEVDLYIASATKVIDTAYASGADAGDALYGEFGDRFEKLETQMAEVSDRMESENAAKLTATRATSASTRIKILTAIGLCAALLLFSLRALAGQIASSLEAIARGAEAVRNETCADLAEALHRLSEGDLRPAQIRRASRIEIRTQDEFARLAQDFNEIATSVEAGGEALESAQAGLATLVARMASVSETLAESSRTAARVTEEASGGSREISQAAEELANLAGQNANAMTTLGRTADGVARGAEQQTQAMARAEDTMSNVTRSVEEVSRASTDVATSAQAGGEKVERAVAAMRRIQSFTEASAAKVQDLDEKGAQIDAIVRTIDAIAEQTNLLALNAAIEAARAGDKGRGFAVVAEEVRKLAEQSSGAAREIGELIHNVRTTVAEAVAAMEQMKSEVQQGAHQTDETGEALRSIVTSIAAVADRIGSVSHDVVRLRDEMTGVGEISREGFSSSERMAKVSTEVTGAVERVAAVSQETAAGAEQLSSTAETMEQTARELATLSQELAETVSHFRIEERPQLRVA